MSQADQAALLLSSDKPVDPVIAQAVLTLPPILSGVSDQFRDMLEAKTTEESHAPALAALADKAEALNTTEAALRTAHGLMQEAATFHPHMRSIHGSRKLHRQRR
jgi:hypothetical protein